MAILRAGLFERVSTDEQAKFGYSIQTQIDALNQYCADNKIKVVDHYTDEGVSAGKPYQKRPEMKRLLDDVQAGKIDIILFTRLDRWFRNVKEYFKVQEILDDNGVAWKAIWEDYDTTTANGRMAITIFLAIHQNEREKGAERVNAVLENKRRNKEACFGGNALPFGYKKEPDEGGIMRLVKDPETQQATQEFWNILISTYNLNKAIRHMGNEYGIHKDWKSWKRMTQSDFYCGIHRGVLDYCPAYVSPEEWLKFQERETIKTTPSGSVYLFRALMRCPDCGNKLCGETTRKAYGIYKAYRCRIRSRGCSNHSVISEKKIEKQLLNNLAKYMQAEIARVELEQKKPKPKSKNMVKSLKEKHRRLTVAYMAGNVPDDQYLKEDAELKALIAKAEAEAPPAPKDVTPLKDVLETDFRSLYETFTDEEKQRFWQGLIKEIKLDGKTVKDVDFF
jgi:DNA invertase Pin-like site-specific DNA recombinase/ribosomal protein L37AE/L43A